MNNLPGVEWNSCPSPSKVWETVSPDGHEKSLRGTQASGEGESHTQDANVAEVDYGEPVNGESKYSRERINHPAESDSGSRPFNAPDKHCGSWGGRKPNQRETRFSLTDPFSAGVWEPCGSLISRDWFPDLARQGEGYRKDTYGRRRNCCVSNAGTCEHFPSGRGGQVTNVRAGAADP